MSSGGYRKPTNPAPTGSSGPGALSRRTDGNQPHENLPNAAYGEQADFQAAQDAGPMAGAAVLPFDRPTERPNEPVTAGAPAGPGVGPQAAGIQMNDGVADYENMKALLPGLQIIANLPGSNPSTRALLRQLQSTIV